MPKLGPLALIKFRDISWDDFMKTPNFEEECVMSLEFGPLDKVPTTILHDKTIKDFISNKRLDNKKKILLFSFYLNSIFLRIKIVAEFAHTNIHMGGLFLFIVALEEEFKPKTINKNTQTTLDSEEILVKKFFFDLKRRVFNIFIYFKCYPKTLEHSLENFVTYKDHLSLNLNMSRSELEDIFNCLEYKKKRCLLEYFNHYTWWLEKTGNIFKLSCAEEYMEEIPNCIFSTIKINNKLLSQNAIKVIENRNK